MSAIVVTHYRARDLRTNDLVLELGVYGTRDAGGWDYVQHMIANAYDCEPEEVGLSESSEHDEHPADYVTVGGQRVAYFERGH